MIIIWYIFILMAIMMTILVVGMAAFACQIYKDNKFYEKAWNAAYAPKPKKAHWYNCS